MSVKLKEKLENKKQDSEEHNGDTDIQVDDNLSQEEIITDSQGIVNVASENTNSELILSSIIPAISQPVNKLFAEAGIATIVDGGKCGRRFVIGDALCEKLGLTVTVQFGFTSDGMLIGEDIPGQTLSFNLKRQGVKYIVYSTKLVKEITEKLNLKFDANHKTSITFYNVVYNTSYDKPIAIVRI